MRKLPQFLFRCSLAALVPMGANAAGTYYTGNYQSPQSRYTQKTYSQGNYSQNSAYTRTAGYQPMNSYSAQPRYNQGNMAGQSRQMAQSAQSQPQRSAVAPRASGKDGFFANAGISREMAQWRFEMNESASILHYDNIDWNVFDLSGGYVFDLGNTKVQVDAGFKYGVQAGETSMVDDDVTNGGYFITQWVDGNNNNTVIGDEIGHALSIGTSDGGSMMGFNIGVGLTDIFQWGNVKFTPSVGYRYLKYKLETKKNYGLSVDTAACFQIDGSTEVQCDPAVIVHLTGDQQQIIWRDSITGKMEVASNAQYIDTGGTYYYQQPGVSHSYEVEWTGPYVAMDMEYKINQYNMINGRVELGFPGYTSTGDQPYRFDWAHPKSVEDKADMFSAFHVGLGANWLTAITDSISLSVGVTYDYYNVSGADAQTFLNPSWYTDMYNDLLSQWAAVYPTDTEAHMLGQIEGVTGDPKALNIKEIEDACPGWVCSSNGEIDSFYKSMGIRVGINAKF